MEKIKEAIHEVFGQAVDHISHNTFTKSLRVMLVSGREVSLEELVRLAIALGCDPTAVKVESDTCNKKSIVVLRIALR